MNRDLSGEEHKVNPPGSTSISDGRNGVGQGGSPMDTEFGPDSIVKVKVESEFEDDSLSQEKVEAQVVKSETLQYNLHTSQDALSIDHGKQEACDSSPMEPRKAAQVLEEKQMKLVSCSNCSQLFDTEVFNQHMTRSVCHEIDKYRSVSNTRSCKCCTETLKDIQGSERPNKCSLCCKSFTLLSSLKMHQRIHKGEKPFKCSVCSKTFSNISGLKIHRRVHTGEKPFTCPVCNRAFARSSYFYRHQRRHTGETPFKCSVCRKGFTFSSNLSQHKKIHTGEKPHKCLSCSKAYSTLSSLRHHKKIHTGDQD